MTVLMGNDRTRVKFLQKLADRGAMPLPRLHTSRLPGAVLSATLTAAALAAPVLVATPGVASAADPSLTQRFEVVADQNAYYTKFTDEARSSVAYGDVTGDGAANVIMGGMDGRVIVASLSGTIVGQYSIGSAEIQAPPALGDLDADGVLDIVIGNIDGDIVALRGNGTELWRNKTDRFADIGKDPSIYGSAAIGDIDNDGRLEVVLASNDHSLNAWNHDGTPVTGFPFTTMDSSWSAPALADIDNDGFAEIIQATDVDYVTAPHAGCPGFGSVIRAIEHTGQQIWQTCIPGEIIMASGSIADLDADGDLDVVYGSGAYFTAIGEAEAPANRVYALDARTGAMLPGWPVDLGADSDATVAIGNLDNDPQLEVATSAKDGQIHVLNHDGTSKWNTCAMYPGTSTFACGPGREWGGISTPVSIADVDNDGKQEVVSFIHTHLFVMDGDTGAVERTSEAIAGDGYAPKGQPTIVEVNGETQIIVQYLREGSGSQNGRDAGDNLVITGYGTGTALGTADWPQFGQNSANTGSAETYWDGAKWMAPWLSAVYEDLLNRTADDSGVTYWSSRLASDLSKGDLANQFSLTDEWLGVVVDDLYLSILDRGPDASGRAYWIGQLRAGKPTADVVSSFFSSSEYFASVGGTNPLFVDALYQGILDRGPDASGKSYWVERLDAGTPRGDLSILVYTSYESGGRRVDSLYASLLNRAPDAGGRDYWANYLTAGDEIALAALLVGSEEYQTRAEARFAI